MMRLRNCLAVTMLAAILILGLEFLKLPDTANRPSSVSQTLLNGTVDIPSPASTIVLIPMPSKVETNPFSKSVAAPSLQRNIHEEQLQWILDTSARNLNSGYSRARTSKAASNVGPPQDPLLSPMD